MSKPKLDAFKPGLQCHMCGKLRKFTDLANTHEGTYCHGVIDGIPTCYQRAAWTPAACSALRQRSEP